MITVSTPDQRRTRVDVQANTPAADALGQMQESWATVATLWGYCRPAKGTELMSARRSVAGQTTALLSHVVETRWPGSLVTVTPLHRLRVGGRSFNVVWADNVEERNATLFIGCVERVTPTGD